MGDADRFMDRCLELAQQALAHGEAAVGAVVVRDGEVVGEGIERVVTTHDVTAHAEIIAIRAACAHLGTLDLFNCTLYTNVEPCFMCSYAIRETRIRRVVVERAVDDIGGITSRFPLLTDESIRDWGSPPDIVWHECG